MGKQQVILIILVLFIIWKFIPCDQDTFRGGRSGGGGRSSSGLTYSTSNRYKKPFNLFTYIKNKFKK